jgi:hypothetical protein
MNLLQDTIGGSFGFILGDMAAGAEEVMIFGLEVAGGSVGGVLLAGAIGWYQTISGIYTWTTEGSAVVSAQSPLTYYIVSAIWDWFASWTWHDSPSWETPPTYIPGAPYKLPKPPSNTIIHSPANYTCTSSGQVVYY